MAAQCPGADEIGQRKIYKGGLFFCILPRAYRHQYWRRLVSFASANLAPLYGRAGDSADHCGKAKRPSISSCRRLPIGRPLGRGDTGTLRMISE